MGTLTAEARTPSVGELHKQLMGLASGFQLSACLYVAAKLNIAELLSAGPRPIEALASETNTDPDALYRVLRALIMVGIFCEPQPHIIGLSPAAELLRENVAGSVRGLVVWAAHPLLIHVHSDLMYSVSTGKPAIEHLYGKSVFECFASMPDVNYDFHNGMTAISADLAPAVLDAYDFSEIDTLMDVAGGHGYFICQALKRHPHMRGILLDQPAVVEGAKCMLCDMRVDHRCTPIAGNFFEHIPAQADGYFMQHIIHDWADEPALRILNNVRQALAGKSKGRVVIVDMVIPEDARPHPGKLLDLSMLLFPGGRERTEAEWRSLLHKAGLRLTRIVPTRVAECVIEAVPA